MFLPLSFDSLWPGTSGEDHMDWWTWLAVIIALLWIVCFIDGNAVLELRLLLHALTKAACHLYLALRLLLRATSHFANCARHLISHAEQQNRLAQGYPLKSQPLARKGVLHFLEGMCMMCEMIANLIGFQLSVGAALYHAMQGGFYVLAATLHTIQVNLFSQMNGEQAQWDKEWHRARESEKKLNSKVLEYISVFCQDAVSALRIKVDVPPVYG